MKTTKQGVRDLNSLPVKKHTTKKFDPIPTAPGSGAREFACDGHTLTDDGWGMLTCTKGCGFTHDAWANSRGY